jgi:hypothetical protein
MKRSINKYIPLGDIQAELHPAIEKTKNIRMKRNIFNIGAITLFVFLIGSCTKNFEEINTNPRIVTENIADPALLLTQVQKESMFGMMGGDGRIEVFSGYIGNDALGNVFQKGPWDEPFATFYKSYIININEAIRISAKDPALADLNSFARIWRAWLYSRLTDLYGDVPYSEAGKDVSNVNVAPSYDTQESIYTDLFKELKEAVGVLKQSDGSRENVGSQDLIYSGDVDKWIRFGNSLRLRLAMRVSYVSHDLASANINEVLTDELIEDNSQNASLVAGGADEPAADNKNPYYNGIPGGAKEFRFASFTTAETLTKLNDPREPKFIDLSTAGDYFGIALNLSQDEKNIDINRPDNSSSALSDLLWRPDFRFTVINASEVAFLRAEAALRGFTSEDAQSLYTTGIGLSMDYFGVDATAKADYLAGSAAVLTGSEEEKDEQIIIQKWIGNYPEFDEGYAEFRRTGYPRIWTGTAPGETNGEIPRRAQYPLSEYNSNSANVTAAAGRLSNGDSFLSKVWWDAKADLPKHHPKQGIYPPF